MRDAINGPLEDIELLRVAREFHVVNSDLDILTEHEWSEFDSTLFGLHQEWTAACSRAATLPAISVEGRKAKAGILLAVLNVVSPKAEERQPHEMLAASLARDLLA